MKNVSDLISVPGKFLHSFHTAILPCMYQTYVPDASAEMKYLFILTAD